MKLGLQIGIQHYTLIKKGDLYLLKMIGRIINEIDQNDFFYTLSLNEDGEIVEKNIELINPTKSELEGWEKSNVITEKIHLAKSSIKALKVLPILPSEHLVCVEENCKYYENRHSYNYACAMKNNTELIFSAVISKEEKPQFFTELKGNIHTFFRIDEVLTEKLKKMLIENMKVHSKERVRLLANGFYFND